MGCVSSKQVPDKTLEPENTTGLTALKDGDTNVEVSRPASSTTRESTVNNRLNSFSSFKGKPGGLQLDSYTAAQSNPNALNTTPHGGGVGGFPSNGENKDRHEEDLNRLAMFIPWEKPALGKTSSDSGVRRPPKLSSAKKKKRLPGGVKTAGKPEACFIPGSGNEKILLAKRPTAVGELPPLEFKKVKANAEVKSQIQKDREKIKKKKKNTNSILKHVKAVFDERDESRNEYTKMRGIDNSRAIVALIQEYAQFGTEAQTQFMVVSKEHQENLAKQSRVSYSCPVRAD